MAGPQPKNLFEGSVDFDWPTYRYARPDYTQSNFYSMIWNYHNANSGHWDTAHDIGSGPGNVAEILAERFSKVIVSDPSIFHLKVAEAHLKVRFGNKVEYANQTGESIGDAYPTGSADMIVTAECMPFIDTTLGMASFAKLLRPGGTLALWFYGGPIFTDPEHENIQTIFRRITARGFDEFRPYRGTAWEQGCLKISSWFDIIPFQSNDWSHTTRLKWNSEYPLFFEDASEHDWDVDLNNIKKLSAIRVDEKVESVIDRSFWAKKVDFAWAKSFVDVQVPRKLEYKTPQVEEMYSDLQRMMDSAIHYTMSLSPSF